MRIALATLAGAAFLSCGGPAFAAPGLRLSPSGEIREVFSQSDSRDETLTYTEAVIGLDGTIETRRIKASLSYQFGRRFTQHGDNDRQQRHTLLARADVTAIDNKLTVSAGAYAALLNRDFRGQVSISPDQDNPNLVQTYSVYIEPHYHQRLPNIGDFDLTYRVGYYDVDENAGSAGGGAGSLPGSAATDVPFDSISDSVNQHVEAKIGNRESGGRFRWDLVGTVTTEDINRLDQTYRAYDGHIEIEYAVRRGVGIIGNVGYEHTRNSEVGVLRDAAGLPIPGPDGGFQPDPTAPRRSIFAQQGVTFEGGLRLQPTRRTYLNFHAGRRFGEFTVNGEARYEVSKRLVFSAVVTQGIDSFGRLLTRDLDGVRVQSVVNSADAAGLGGCVFGVDPGSGSCLFNATQSITNATFRNRSAQFIAEAKHGRLSGSLAVIMSQRTFLDTQQLQAPGTPAVDQGIGGGPDKTLSINAQLSRVFVGGQQISFGVYANRYRFALSEQRSDHYYGATANYAMSIGRNIAVHLTGTGTRRVSDVVPTATDVTASAGLRFQF